MIDIRRVAVNIHRRRVLYLSLPVSLCKEIRPVNCSPDAFEAKANSSAKSIPLKFEATTALSSTRFHTRISTNENFRSEKTRQREREREGSLDMVVNVRFSDTQVALQVAESWVIYSWLGGGTRC